MVGPASQIWQAGRTWGVKRKNKRGGLIPLTPPEFRDFIPNLGKSVKLSQTCTEFRKNCPKKCSKFENFMEFYYSHRKCPIFFCSKGGYLGGEPPFEALLKGSLHKTTVTFGNYGQICSNHPPYPIYESRTDFFTSIRSKMSSLKQKYIEKKKYISFRWKGQNPSKTFRFEGLKVVLLKTFKNSRKWRQ